MKYGIKKKGCLVKKVVQKAKGKSAAKTPEQVLRNITKSK